MRRIEFASCVSHAVHTIEIVDRWKSIVLSQRVTLKVENEREEQIQSENSGCIRFGILRAKFFT